MNKYKIEIEIFEGNGGDLENSSKDAGDPDFAKEGICPWMYRGDGEKSYQQGHRFNYPEDIGKMCPWMLDSINSAVRVLNYGGTLPWKYENTPYLKEIDKDGVTTEFMRCVDPTDSGIVMKIIRTKL